MAKSWYVYTGFGDPAQPSSYAKTTVKHNHLCGNQISVICAEGENFHPDAPFSANLLIYIQAAIATGSIQPAFPGEKKFVYLKRVES